MGATILDPQTEQFLAAAHFAYFATIGHDLYPQVTVMWYQYAAGHFYMTTTTDRVKYRNVRRNPKVGFTVGSDPYKALSVKADVIAFLTDDLPERNRRIAARYTLPAELNAQVAALMKDDRVILDMIPRAIVKIGTW